MKTVALSLMFMFAASAPVVGQTRPKITQITNGADFTPRLTYGQWASSFGTGLSDVVYTPQTATLPQKLGKTEVFFCYYAPVPASQIANIISFLGCVPTSLSYVSQTQINFLTPSQSSVSIPKVPGADGSVFFIVSVNGVLDENANAQPSVKWDSYRFNQPQPSIFGQGTDCLIDSRYQNRSTVCGLTFEKLSGNRADRGAVTDLQGRVISSSNPAKLGGWYTIWLTGTGAFANGKFGGNPTLLMTNIPVYGYPGDTWQPISTALYAPSPQFSGLAQVNFQVPTTIATSDPNWHGYPPPFPCGNYDWEVSLDFVQGGNHANLVQIPIVVKRGDVPCSQ